MKYAVIALLLAATSMQAQDTRPDHIQPAKLGAWYAEGDTLPEDWSADLIIRPDTEDGLKVWRIVPVNSCEWYCGQPMTLKQAMFDKKSSLLGLAQYGAVVADIELTHHSPCFVIRTCREINPLLGQGRPRAYGVTAALILLNMLAGAELRKGDLGHHIGGTRHVWWILRAATIGVSAVGITHSLVYWNRR